jgi:hypothetical protein
LSQNLSHEVDFDVFAQRFWPKVQQETKLSSFVVWTEIFSEIKGRAYSWEFRGGIPPNLYIRWSDRKGKFLTPEE